MKCTHTDIILLFIETSIRHYYIGIFTNYLSPVFINTFIKQSNIVVNIYFCFNS